jgi:hypothetical protein
VGMLKRVVAAEKWGRIVEWFGEEHDGSSEKMVGTRCDLPTPWGKKDPVRRAEL